MEPRDDDPPLVPRGDLESALTQVMDSARAALVAQDRLRELVRANQVVAGQLDLPTVLQRIVDAAVRLVGAEYGALGVIDAEHIRLEQFIYEGISPRLAAKIGHLPEGHGLLGALIAEPHPIRLEHLADDPRSSGFPAHHPPMDSFLGVPIRVRGEVFGNLYLTNQRHSGEFSAEDEQLVESLATTAGFAIENARLFAETQLRQHWAAAAAEITAALLAAGGGDPMALIAERALEAAEAAHVRIVVPTDDAGRLRIQVARGLDLGIEGQTVATDRSVSGSVLAGRTARLLQGDDVAELTPLLSGAHRAGSIVAVPLLAEDRVRGVLVVVREAGTRRFAASDLEVIADFAGQATRAMELADARAARQRTLLNEDRSRIARDLHDHVIQQLFAGGLELQSLAGTLPPADAARIDEVVSSLDEAIAQIRTVVFALSTARNTSIATLRHRILDLAGDVDRRLPHTPAVAFTGPVDLAVTGALADDVTAVVREALTNVAKHSGAETASVHITVADGQVRVEVSDDGVGIAPGGRRSGLANLEARATARGGAFTVGTGPTGTRLLWSAPLPEAEGPDDA